MLRSNLHSTPNAFLSPPTFCFYTKLAFTEHLSTAAVCGAVCFTTFSPLRWIQRKSVPLKDGHSPTSNLQAFARRRAPTSLLFSYYHYLGFCCPMLFPTVVLFITLFCSSYTQAIDHPYQVHISAFQTHFILPLSHRLQSTGTLFTFVFRTNYDLQNFSNFSKQTDLCPNVLHMHRTLQHLSIMRSTYFTVNRRVAQINTWPLNFSEISDGRHRCSSIAYTASALDIYVLTSSDTPRFKIKSCQSK